MAIAAVDSLCPNGLTVGADIVKPAKEAMPNNRAGCLGVRARGQLEQPSNRGPFILAVKEPSFVAHVRPPPLRKPLTESRAGRSGVR